MEICNSPGYIFNSNYTLLLTMNIPEESQDIIKASEESIKPKYTIEMLYEQYVERENIDKRRKAPHELRQIRKAFYGGIANVLLLQAIELPKVTEDEARMIIHEMIGEAGKFFENNI